MDETNHSFSSSFYASILSHSSPCTVPHAESFQGLFDLSGEPRCTPNGIQPCMRALQHSHACVHSVHRIPPEVRLAEVTFAASGCPLEPTGESQAFQLTGKPPLTVAPTCSQAITHSTKVLLGRTGKQRHTAGASRLRLSVLPPPKGVLKSQALSCPATLWSVLP